MPGAVTGVWPLRIIYIFCRDKNHVSIVEQIERALAK